MPNRTPWITVHTDSINTSCQLCKRIFITSGVLVYTSIAMREERLPEYIRADTIICPRCTLAQKERLKNRQDYLLIMHGDVEPELVKVDSYDAAVRAAKHHRQGDGDKDDGLYPVLADWANRTLEVYTFTGGVLDDEEEEDGVGTPAASSHADLPVHLDGGDAPALRAEGTPSDL